MKIKVMELLIQPSKTIILFSTEYGQARAVWDGSLPEINKEYFVEVEIEYTLTWGIDIVKVEEELMKIGINDRTIYLIGYLESVEGDGYTVVRVHDSIITLVTKGNPIPVGTYIKIEVDEITLYNLVY